MIKNAYLIFLVVSLSGCASITHLDKILTLQDMAAEAETMDVYVEEQDKKYEMLKEAYRNDTLENYNTKEKISQTFGEPAFIGHQKSRDKDIIVWMYRYAVKYFDSDKMYLYFDEKGSLINWEYREKETKNDSSG